MLTSCYQNNKINQPDRADRTDRTDRADRSDRPDRVDIKDRLTNRQDNILNNHINNHTNNSNKSNFNSNKETEDLGRMMDELNCLQLATENNINILSSSIIDNKKMDIDVDIDANKGKSQIKYQVNSYSNCIGTGEFIL